MEALHSYEFSANFCDKWHHIQKDDLNLDTCAVREEGIRHEEKGWKQTYLLCIAPVQSIWATDMFV
jgi:hypothetical protein